MFTLHVHRHILTHTFKTENTQIYAYMRQVNTHTQTHTSVWDPDCDVSDVHLKYSGVWGFIDKVPTPSYIKFKDFSRTASQIPLNSGNYRVGPAGVLVISLSKWIALQPWWQLTHHQGVLCLDHKKARSHPLVRYRRFATALRVPSRRTRV